MQPTHSPTFQPGFGTRFPDRCVSSVDRLGAFRVEPCTVGGDPDGPSLYTGGELVPIQFSGPPPPPPLNASWFPTSGAGSLGIIDVFVVNRFGQRQWALNGTGVNEVSLDAGLHSFSLEATVWGNVMVGGVAFQVGTRRMRVAPEAPWYITPRKEGSELLDAWGYWTAGHVVNVTVSPRGLDGDAVAVYPKEFLVRVLMET